jgi:hypothetical protein
VSERFDDYLVFYQPCQDGIEVLRVIHGAQHLDSLFAKDEALD